MREVISINIGQAGVQLSNAAWELFCIEHGILANGMLKDHLKEEDSAAFQTFFQQVPGGQYVPRAISVDLEPTVLDEVRTGPYRNLWHPDQLISGFEDAANNYARGHFTLGKTLIDDTAERIRKAADNCDVLQGFIVMGSMSGGTGAGFASLILERLAVEFTKRLKYQLIIVPSTTLATAIVDPYNCVLTLNASAEHAEICSNFENEAVYKICADTLDITRPTYNNLNRVISQVISSMTVSLRYESSLNADLDQINTNLVPYPRIHFPSINYCPIISLRRAEHEKLSCHELTRNLFETSSQMTCCDMLDGKYMSCCLQFRGDITPKQVNSAIFEIKRRTDIKFVSWCPTGFKLGINSQPPTSVPSSEMAQVSRSVMMMTNSTAICQLWKGILQKYDILFSKRSFVHWYVGEGMEEGEFNEAKDEVTHLVQDYEECAIEEEDIEDELDDGPTPAPGAVPINAESGTTAADEPAPDFNDYGAGQAEDAGGAYSENVNEDIESAAETEEPMETEATEAEDEDEDDEEDDDDEEEEEEFSNALSSEEQEETPGY